MRKSPVLALAIVLFAFGCTTKDGLAPEPKAGPAPSAGVLAPLERLKPDTAEAALYDWKAAGTPHVGVWSSETAGCGQIDQSTQQGFAVVTVKTLRLDAANCAISFKSASEPVAALCSSGGATAPREFTFTQRGDDGLVIAEPTAKSSTAYVRCRLP